MGYLMSRERERGGLGSTSRRASSISTSAMEVVLRGSRFLASVTSWETRRSSAFVLAALSAIRGTGKKYGTNKNTDFRLVSSMKPVKIVVSVSRWTQGHHGY